MRTKKFVFIDWVRIPEVLVCGLGRYRMRSADVKDAGGGVLIITVSYKRSWFTSPGTVALDFYGYCRNPEAQEFLEVHPLGWGDAKCKTFLVSFSARQM